MSPLDTVPWNTILFIIGVSLLIPSLLATLFLRLKRYEDVGLAIGVFLLILGSVTYLYLIPQEIIAETKLPEDYIWEDTGMVKYWERNGLFLKGIDQRRVPFLIQWLLPERTPIIREFLATEVIHVSEFHKESNKALIHDVIYDDTGEVLSVINNTQKVSEWYWVDSHNRDLSYVNVDAGRMGIPAVDKKVTTLRVGWVESNGQQNGTESIVLVRDMQRIKNGYIDGVEVSVWRSDIYNTEITWHGKTYYCDETLQLTVNPASGYIVHVYRHLVLSAHLSEFLSLYYPSAMRSQIITNYLRISDPIGEAAELTYNTTEESMDTHLEAVRDITNLMIYVPLWVCIPIFLVGAALTWRFLGRSYYWKRYREYEPYTSASYTKAKRTASRKKPLAVGLCFLLLVSTLTYVVIQQTQQETPDMKIPPVIIDSPISGEENEPTPPGLKRVIDSGRHILLPEDEGNHKFSNREWWYFNVFFNDPYSDLQGYSMIVSFNRLKFSDVRFLRPDNLFILLFDDTDKSYIFSTLNKRRGTLKSTNPGADVMFENSWVKGSYPSWNVHIVNDEKGFIADLDFTADFLPVWVIGRSTNLPFKSLITGGDYYVPRCKVKGNISWDGKQYHVGGIGYHDHVWNNIVPRWVSKGWDWANIHFDNGWELSLSKFNFRLPFELHDEYLIITPNNRNITQFNYFKTTYTETANPKGLPFMHYPKKIHIEAQREDIILKLDIEVYNTCENVWKRSRSGMFEGPCYAKGTISWSDYTVELNGYGYTEYTRVKYLFGLPGIFQKF